MIRGFDTSRENGISFRDLSMMTLLVHECCQLGTDPSAWQLRFLQGLQDLLDAPMVLLHKATGLGRLGRDGRPAIVTVVDVGFDDDFRRVFAEYTNSFDARDCPLEVAMNLRNRAGEVFSVRDSDVLDATTWRQSHLFSKCLQPNGVTSIMCARFVSQDGVAYSVIPHRVKGQALFSETDRDLLYYGFTQVASLLGNRLADPSHRSMLDQLRKREREVLFLFLEGNSENDVARHLGISSHTVRDYAKRLNKTFDVHSRDQLIAATLHFHAILNPVATTRNGNHKPADPKDC